MPRTKTRGKKKERWYQPGSALNWRKDASQMQRRRAALASRKGDLLTTARALNALANVTRDTETETKARADAKYFFTLYRKKNRK